MKLYHATFSKLLRKIKKVGYLGNSPYKLWSDSDNRYVYLASDPDEAYSYAETALDEIDNERLYNMLEDDEIVILETDTKFLDKSKLFKDKNVIDGETTYQYEGIINCQCLKIFDMNKYNNEIEECLRIAGVKLNESYGRMISVNDFSKEHYDIILIGSVDELKKKSNIGDLLLLHGNVYEIKKIGRSDKTHELCALLININNPKDRAIRSLNYLSKELPHLIKKKNKILESVEEKIIDYHDSQHKKFNFDNFNAGVQLNEELIHAEKSNYDDYMAVVLKNPTKRELRENGLDRSRFICFEDGTWLFFDSMQWIHAHIWNKYKDKFGDFTNMGVYDLHTNEFIFVESMDYDEDEKGYEEEFNYYESKNKKWLLEQPYIVNTFGTDFKVIGLIIHGNWRK